MKRTLALVAVSALLAACSSPAEDAGSPSVADRGGDAPRAEAKAPGARSPKSGAKTSRPKPRTGPPKERSERGGVAPAREPTASSDAEEPAAPAPAATPGERKAARRPQGANGRASAPTPRAGRYTYAQSGWEEFCAGTCNRQQLPSTQDTDQKVGERGDRTFQIVTTVRSGQNRSVRSTSLLTRSAMEITKVELTYGNFSEAYEPAPPVTSLRLPLRVGDAWSGSWKADTSGDYRFEVVGAETLVVDGRRIKTFKLDTRTNFRGDFRGHATAITWIDPRTVTPIRSSGKVRLSTNFGRFNSNFDQMLLEGPGY